ncbi:MAG: peptidylprolyl isomerase, partial [Muribaculaceae bacterium]|nr:peptidylprolyl isomerase [Muribaculaceae bacterium]
MSTDTNNVKVEISTTMGDITIMLYGDTPKHRDNFVKLAKEGFYDGTLFHRVINEFMVQAGDPDSKTAKPGQHLGSGDPGYTIEAEIEYPAHFHKRGALAAARTADQVNPERRSSGSQFYIVTGKAYNEQQIGQLENQLSQMQMQGIFQQL